MLTTKTAIKALYSAEYREPTTQDREALCGGRVLRVGEAEVDGVSILVVTGEDEDGREVVRFVASDADGDCAEFELAFSSRGLNRAALRRIN